MYVAIKEVAFDTGTIIHGSYPYPGMPVPPPFFNYMGPMSPSDKYPEVNNSLKILYGHYQEHESPETLNSYLSVIGINNFPYQTDSGAIILNVDKNGTVFMTYNNTSINLSVSDTWTSPIVSTRLDTVNTTNYSYVARYNLSYEFTNLGIFEKSNLTK